LPHDTLEKPDAAMEIPKCLVPERSHELPRRAEAVGGVMSDDVPELLVLASECGAAENPEGVKIGVLWRIGQQIG
jgi:hypothetical protein